MSHNKISVNAQTPDRAGQITQSINDLDDVSISGVANNQFLSYSTASSAWGNTGALVSTMAMIGDGSSQSYPTGGSAIGAAVALEFYGPLYNGIGATIGTGWINSITLAAGDYSCTAVSGVTMSSSTGVVTFRWHDGAALVGTTGSVGDDTISIGSAAVAYITLASPTAVEVQCVTASNVNTLALQGTRAAEFGYVEIRAL